MRQPTGVDSPNYIHGHARHGQRSREWRIWWGARRRCYDAADAGYPRYGGRGIGMATRWKDDFREFINDMGPCPPGHWLDRINNDGNYEPGNCRWATPAQQMRNKSTNRWITINGVTKCAIDWAIEAGVRKQTMNHRLVAGWPVDRLLTPSRQASGHRK